LPEDARMVILLHLEGLSGAEMAYALGCAAGAVGPRLSRSRAALRQKLAEYRV
jgi:DNA-directed RNA polymerase specialized sigma24 family protein